MSHTHTHILSGSLTWIGAIIHACQISLGPVTLQELQAPEVSHHDLTVC